MSLLALHDVHVRFNTAAGVVRAVNGVSLDLAVGETLGLVGESGCGKSTLGKAIMRLVPIADGAIEVDGVDIAPLDRDATERDAPQGADDLPGSLRLAQSALDGRPLGRPAAGHRRLEDRRHQPSGSRRCCGWVGLPPDARQRYPHEFSGGQRQRIGIARALALNPKLIICDEPVSALDVSVRAQVINLLEDLKGQFGVSYLFISHDLSVVEHIADRVAVMYLGTLVEVGGARSDLAQSAAPLHQGPAGGGADRRSQGSPAPASAPCCRASCRARSIRRPAARSIRAARSPRSAASPTGRCCGRSATARWQRAISSELAMIRRMKTCLARAPAQPPSSPPPWPRPRPWTSPAPIPARPSPSTAAPRSWRVAATAWTATWISWAASPSRCAPCCSTIPRPTAPTRRPSLPRCGPSGCGHCRSARRSRRATAPAARTGTTS